MVWPHALPAAQVNFVSAALRHIQDASQLVSSSPVQAFYLAGYGPECVRKAALTFPDEKVQEQIQFAIGHGFKKHAETALSIAMDVDPMASRYGLSRWGTRQNILQEWNERCRYGRCDSIRVSKARKLIEKAEPVVTDVVLALWADGRLPPLNDLLRVLP